MSDSEGGPGRREVAYRLFAAEYDDADLSYSESDEERAPNYVVTPSGARVNRLFVVGVLTEVESVSEDYLRARVVDPTGPFVVYAGQYQPEAMGFLETADPPTFVAVTGKARTFQPDDADRVYTSIRPESINEVDAATRDRWVVQAADATIDRVARAAEAKASGLEGDVLEASLAAAGVEEGLASGIPTALAHYGTTGEYLAALRDVSLDALRVVAGERDEVDATLPAPAAGDADAVQELAQRTLEAVSAEAVDDRATAAEDAESGTVASAATESEAGESETDEAGAVESEAARAEAAEPDRNTAESTEPDGSDPADRTATEQSPSGQGEAEGATADVGDASDTGDETPDVDAEPSAAESDDATTDARDAQVATANDAVATTGEPGQGATESTAVGDFEAEYDLDDEEREEIESEYGTEFKSGSEVEEPGATDIDTPEPGTDESDVVATDQAPESAVDTAAGAVDTDEGDTPSEQSTDVALDDAVMDAMADLDEGDGADREAVIEAVVDRTGAEPGDVEDAIQEALMDGRCYEPADGTLKPI